MALGVTFHLYLNVYAGIRGVDALLVEAGKSLGLGRWWLIRHVVLPGALPGAMTGLRYSLATAWPALALGESVNAVAAIGFLMKRGPRVLPHRRHRRLSRRLRPHPLHREAAAMATGLHRTVTVRGLTRSIDGRAVVDALDLTLGAVQFTASSGVRLRQVDTAARPCRARPGDQRHCAVPKRRASTARRRA